MGVTNLDEIDVPAWRFLCAACKCTCTSLPLVETRLTGDTNADIGLERAVGSLVACNSAGHVQNVSFKFGLARARGQQHCTQHREHLLSSKQNSDGPRFYIWHKESTEFLFRASGRHPNVWILSLEAVFLRGLTNETDGLIVTQLHVFQTLRTIWPSVHQVRCSTQSFRNRAHQQGKVVSFPLPSGEHQTTTLRTLT